MCAFRWHHKNASPACAVRGLWVSAVTGKANSPHASQIPAFAVASLTEPRLEASAGLWLCLGARPGAVWRAALRLVPRQILKESIEAG